MKQKRPPRHCAVCGKAITKYAQLCRAHYLARQREQGTFVPPPSTAQEGIQRPPGECADCGRNVTPGSWRCHACHVLFMNQSRQKEAPRTLSGKLQAENALLASLGRSMVIPPPHREDRKDREEGEH